MAGHAHRHLSGQAPGYLSRAVVTQNLSAVTGACLLTRKDVFRQVGGMDERAFRVAYNDVDYCLTVRSAGYDVVWTPHAVLRHAEGASRGSDDTPEKVRRTSDERTAMRTRWGRWIDDDPFYSPHLTRLTEGFELREPHEYPPSGTEPPSTPAP